jgi:two-component system cell cycle sensor histidine kinase/response regulator CckA
MTRPIRVLHLEDSPRDAEMIRHRLDVEEVSCDILLTDNKDSFEAALAREPFDLIISDYNLPGYNGVAALKHAQTAQPEVPVILISGTVVEEQAVECLHIGATDYLLKDRLERLVPAVRRALQEAETRRARHLVETALGDSESRKAAILDSVLDCIVTMDAVGNVIEFNTAASRTFGYSKAEAIGRPLADLIIPPQFRERHSAGLARYLATGEGPIIGKLIEITAVRSDGTEIPVELTITAIRSDSATIFTGVLRDITARRQADDTRASLASIVNSSDDAISSVGMDETILTWNAGAERLFGYPASEMIGRNRAVLVPAEKGAELVSVMERAARGEMGEVLETRRVRKDGSVVDIALVTSPMTDSTGRVTGVSTIARDITGRKKAEAERQTLEAQYQQAQKMEAIGRLAGGVAHDFNNLLTVILGFCELLLADLTPDDPRQSDIAEIQNAGTRAAGLTRQLLAFSRKEIIQPKLLDLNLIVSDIRVMLGRLIGEDVTIVLDLGPAIAPVNADRGQMEQIVLNLAVNARDAMPKGGTLTIRTANVEVVEPHAQTHAEVKPGPYVVLTITDTGTGMTQAVQERLFEPFFTTKEAGKGTGLGLATVHGIATQNGGGITIDSELGRGSSFMVYVPRADVVEPVVTAPPPVHRNRARVQTVLVVEDAEGLRELTKRLLERQGYTVLIAANADEARRLFDEHPSIDLLLTDVVMPGPSGPDLVKQLVATRPALKVIYMSGYTDETIVHHGVLDAGILFLHKPFSSESLGRKLREALD